MHQHHPAIRQDFVKFDDDLVGTTTHVKAVMDSLWRAREFQQPANTDVGFVEASPQWINQLDYSTMIFLNTAAKAKQFADSLYELGFDFVEIHGMVRREERERNLALFRKRGDDVKVNIMVCTDACARGLDLPHVRRVVQGEFALNVVQHLHRIGRSSRGGAVGMAINLYGKNSKDLVHSIIGNYEESTNGIEQSFSRRRGFRQKLKKATSGKEKEENAPERKPLL